MYGGEKTGLDAVNTDPLVTMTLTSDVNIMSFGPATSTSMKLPIVCPETIYLYKSASGQRDASQWCGYAPPPQDDIFVCCPVPRRDAASALFGNSPQSNGKLIVYGGMGCPASVGCISSPVGQFLSEGTGISTPISLDDLWYLELSDVDHECAKAGQCSENLLETRWVQVEIPGNKPMSRWGASLIIDTSNQLYLTVRFPTHGSSSVFPLIPLSKLSL